MRALRSAGLVFSLILIASAARADEPINLPGASPLTLEGDIAAEIVDGVDRKSVV